MLRAPKESNFERKHVIVYSQFLPECLDDTHNYASLMTMSGWDGMNSMTEKLPDP